MIIDPKQTERDIVALNLKRLLRENKKKQVDLVRDLDLSQAIVSEYLNAKKYPAPDKMQLLADYFGVMKSDIMQEKPATKEGDGLSPERKAFMDKVMKLSDSQFRMVHGILDQVLAAQDSEK